MSVLREKKLRFIEILITVGSLLGVFLAFAVSSKITPLIQEIVWWGTTFSALSILIYSFLLFEHKPIKGWGMTISFTYFIAVLGGSFAILVGYGYTIGFTGTAPDNIWLALAIVGVVIGLVLVVYYGVVRVLVRKESGTEDTEP